MVDWVRLCREHGIAYDERGTSVKRDNINIACPFCRAPDVPGRRLMGLALGTPKWGCWKDERHRGRNADYLVSRLLHVSREEARSILGLRPPPSAVADLQAEFDALQAPVEPPEAEPPEVFPEFQLPSVCYKLRPRGKRSRRFVDYLVSRGLGVSAIARYDLYGSDQDFGWGRDRTPLASRVIIPLYRGGVVVGYTGRAIDRAARRYHTEPAGAAAQSLWFEQLAGGGQLLVVVEGQFDAMVLDAAATAHGLPVSAVALGGLARTRGKTRALERAARRYRRTVLLLDDSALAQSLWMQRDLGASVEVGVLPPGVGDPGELSARQARLFLESCLVRSLSP